MEALHDYIGYLCGIARRMMPGVECEDLVQEVFVRTLSASCVPKEPRRLRGYLATVARNVAIDWNRRRRRVCWQPFCEENCGAEDRALCRMMTREEVARRMDVLSPTLRRAVEEFYMAGKTHRELGEELGITPAAVAQRLHRARRLMAKVEVGGSA